MRGAASIGRTGTSCGMTCGVAARPCTQHMEHGTRTGFTRRLPCVTAQRLCPRWHSTAPSPPPFALHRASGRMSAEVVWQVIKKNNAFLRKGSTGRHDAIFSAEPGNLYARHSFKHSGVCPAGIAQSPGTASGGASQPGGPLRAAFSLQGLGLKRPGLCLTRACPLPVTRPSKCQDAGHHGRQGGGPAREGDQDEREARTEARQAGAQRDRQGCQRPQGHRRRRGRGGQVPTRPEGTPTLAWFVFWAEECGHDAGGG